MDKNQVNSPKSFRNKRRAKGKNSRSQMKRFYEYLQTQTATASMVSDETGIPQKNICRLKRKLEKAGLLWEVQKRFCQKTGYRAWYLTTDPNKAPFDNQIKMFPA
jgi:hypothetical protein